MTQSSNQKIYIYGGSFNPPTIAHQAIVEACLAQPECGELWLMPSGDRYDKSIKIGTDHRINLLNEFTGSIACKKDVRIENLEIERETLTQTFETVELLKDKYPDKEFRYIFGSDSYHSMETWGNGAFLKDNLEMLIIPRDGEQVEYASNIKILKIHIPEEVSSTEVRQLVQESETIDQLVCVGVERYIRILKLYVQ